MRQLSESANFSDRATERSETLRAPDAEALARNQSRRTESAIVSVLMEVEAGLSFGEILHKYAISLVWNFR